MKKSRAIKIFGHEATDSFAITDVGKVRKNNEDALLLMPAHGCYAVSDGMGGGKAGEVASSMMVRELHEAVSRCVETPSEREGAVIRSAYKVNYLIKDYACDHNYSAMGATFVCLVLDPWHPETATVFHAGDSRAYRMRGNKLEQLMEDHTVAATTHVAENRIAPMFRGVLTNALGTGVDFFLERTAIDVQKDDIFLVCSDGLTRMVSDSELERIFVMNSRDTSENITKTFLELALERGGRDNVSIIVLKIKELGESYIPSDQEADIEAEAQVRNLMDLTDTQPTEVVCEAFQIKKRSR